ncbi:MAG: acyl-[acyl-carrier-protein] thioesterase [Alistipes sp.]|jgi:acyl-ACP thioesterase|nr:acyl-[acyl-carrier-protein] thioesterase [Alistipes sp.]
MAGTYRYRIGSRDIDASQHARLCTMGDLILGAAGDDADMSGFGVSDLNTGNASWVLSRMAVELRRLPSRGEPVDIHTWVSGYGRLFTTRNMTLAGVGAGGGAGEQFGAAVTLWAMIDLDTRRPLDLSSLSNRAGSLVDREPPVGRPLKVGPVDGVAGSSYTVVYSDIDFNGHVNSMKYLEWMVDTLPAGALAGLSSVRLDINYLHEATLGEALTICPAAAAATDTGVTHRFDIRNASGVSVCRAAIAGSAR